MLIPPIYDQLGWSDGGMSVHQGVIGFRNGSLWGLIGINNKVQFEPAYYKLVPFNEKLFSVARRGKYANRFYMGLVDARGRIKLNLEYFQIQNQAGLAVFSEWFGQELKYGAFDADFNLLIPPVYDDIETTGQLLMAHKNGLINLLNLKGQLLDTALNHVEVHEDFVKLMRDGQYGARSLDGRLLFDIDQKDVLSSTESKSFPDWTVVRERLLFTIACDSLDYLGEETWIAHYNGYLHLLFPNGKIEKNDYELKYFGEGFALLKDLSSANWSAIDQTGKVVIEVQDSIYFNGRYFFGRAGKKWKVFDLKGAQLNEQPVDAVLPSTSSLVGMKKYGLWGILNTREGIQSAFRFDSLAFLSNIAVVKYIEEWGVIGAQQEWLVPPRYEEVHALSDHIFVAKRKNVHEIYRENLLQFKTPYEVLLNDFLLTKNESGHLRLHGSNGKPFVDTFFEAVNKYHQYYELRDSLALLFHQDGRHVLNRSDGIQSVHGFGDGFFMIKKDGAYGFVDQNGNLRIANRYDSVGLFAEGMAAIQIRGSWGYINKAEKLVVQPFYEEAGPFRKGLAIVKQDGFYGLLNLAGDLVLDTEWLAIRSTNFGNYILTHANGKQAICNERGLIFLSAGFERLTDASGERVIAKRSGKWGVVNYEGQPVVDFRYDDLEYAADMLLLKKGQ